MYTLLIGITVFLLDRFSKILVEHRMYPGESIPVISGIFHLTFVRNPGAAFGLLAEQRGLFLVTSTVIIVLILVFIRRLDELGWLYRLVFGLVLGGAAGNLYDRLLTGRVVDFLDFRVWPVFNLADSAIVIAALLLAYRFIFAGDKGEKRSERAR